MSLHVKILKFNFVKKKQMKRSGSFNLMRNKLL